MILNFRKRVLSRVYLTSLVTYNLECEVDCVNTVKGRHVVFVSVGLRVRWVCI